MPRGQEPPQVLRGHGSTDHVPVAGFPISRICEVDWAKLLAEAMGDVSEDHVWRVLRA